MQNLIIAMKEDLGQYDRQRFTTGACLEMTLTLPHG